MKELETTMITTLLLQYAVSALAITFAGILLVRSGEAIAERFHLGHVWLGSILIAAATSFPELITSIKAVSNQSYDMSLSNIYGSVLFNLAILGAAVLTFSKWKQESPEATIKIATFFSVFLITISLIFIHFKTDHTFLNLGIGSWIILISYVIYIKQSFVQEEDSQDNPIKEKKDLLKHLSFYCAAVLLIFVAGIFCVHVAEELVRATGWGERFVGVLFLALATSLPEIVTVFQAARMQSLTLILGIIWGSNIFNLCIVSVSDFFAGNTNLLSQMSQENKVTAVLTILFAFTVPFLLSLGLKKRFLSLKTAGLVVIVAYTTILFTIFYQSL